MTNTTNTSTTVAEYFDNETGVTEEVTLEEILEGGLDTCRRIKFVKNQIRKLSNSARIKKLNEERIYELEEEIFYLESL
jgi:phage major head subunit gpT-like protein